MLRRANKIFGYSIRTSDGDIGQVYNRCFDYRTQALGYGRPNGRLAEYLGADLTSGIQLAMNRNRPPIGSISRAQAGQMSSNVP